MRVVRLPTTEESLGSCAGVSLCAVTKAGGLAATLDLSKILARLPAHDHLRIAPNGVDATMADMGSVATNRQIEVVPHAYATLVDTDGMRQ